MTFRNGESRPAIQIWESLEGGRTEPCAWLAEGCPGLGAKGRVRGSLSARHRHHCLKERLLGNNRSSLWRTDRSLRPVGVAAIRAAQNPNRDVSRKHWATWAPFSDLGPGSSPRKGCHHQLWAAMRVGGTEDPPRSQNWVVRRETESQGRPCPGRALSQCPVAACGLCSGCWVEEIPVDSPEDTQGHSSHSLCSVGARRRVRATGFGIHLQSLLSDHQGIRLRGRPHTHTPKLKFSSISLLRWCTGHFPLCCKFISD